MGLFRYFGICFLASICFSNPVLAQTESPSFWQDGYFPFGDPPEPVPPGLSLFKLVTLSNDRDQNLNYLHLLLDESRSIHGMYSLPDPNNKGSSEGPGRSVFWLQDIQKPEGAVIFRARGRDLMIMQGQLDPATQEGQFKIRFLTNGLFGRYDSCDFYLRKAGEGWGVQNFYTGLWVTDVRVRTHSLGITTLEGLCPKKGVSP